MAFKTAGCIRAHSILAARIIFTFIYIEALVDAVSDISKLAPTSETSGLVGADTVRVARFVLTLINIDVTFISSPSFLTRARIAIDLVDTLPVGAGVG